MELDNVLSVGSVFDYPLIGGESLYGLLPTLNDKFSLDLTEDDFLDQKTFLNPSNGLMTLVAIDNEGDRVYNFVNLENKGVALIDTISIYEPKSSVISRKPINFKEEMDFLALVELNKSIEYNLFNSKTIVKLQRLLVDYAYGNWNIVDNKNNRNVAGFILRYYGSGDKVPEEYGTYDAEVTVAIIDLKENDLYSTYCLRTKKYHVYDNGYRSGD